MPTEDHSLPNVPGSLTEEGVEGVPLVDGSRDLNTADGDEFEAETLENASLGTGG